MDQGKPLMATDSPLVDFDAVCQKVRAAVEPARTHAVSLHDELGDVLWLSESSMGPDEHNAVREAAEAFTSPSTGPVLAIDLGDLRSAVLVRAVNNRRAFLGDRSRCAVSISPASSSAGTMATLRSPR